MKSALYVIHNYIRSKQKEKHTQKNTDILMDNNNSSWFYLINGPLTM